MSSESQVFSYPKHKPLFYQVCVYFALTSFVVKDALCSCVTVCFDCVKRLLPVFVLSKQNEGENEGGNYANMSAQQF